MKFHFLSREMLSKLQESLKTGFCANYWIPTINLFDKLRESDLISKRALMAQVSDNPQRFVADAWLEYVRYVRLNCCYCGSGYDATKYEVVEVLQEESDTSACWNIKSKYDGSECPCSSFNYKNDPLSLDVY